MAITRLNSLAIPAGTVEPADISYPLTNFSSTGIDDNATSNAITIDASENTFFSSANTHAASVNVTSFANTTTGEPVAIAFGAVADNGGTGNEGGIYFDAGADGSASNNQLQFNADHQSTVTPDMVITGSGNVGIGTTTPNYSLDTSKSIYSGLDTYTGTNYGDIPGFLYLNGDVGGYGIVGSINSTQKFLLNGGSSNIGFLTYDTTGLYIQSDQARADFGVTQGTISFKTGSSFTERMRIDSSGNVGIGTTSPADELEIEGADPAIRWDDTSAGGYARLEATNGSMVYESDQGNSVANSTHIFKVDGTERVRIDSTGNVGIAGTPASFGSGVATLQLKGLSSSQATRAGALRFISNDGTSCNTAIYSDNGFISFYTGTSSDSNLNMQIASNGNIGIGVTGPSPVHGGKVLQVSNDSGAEVIVHRSDSGVVLNDYVGGFLFYNGDSSGSPPHYAGMIGKASNIYGSTNIEFYAGRAALEAHTSAAPHMVITGDSSDDSNVGIGIVPTHAASYKTLEIGQKTGGKRGRIQFNTNSGNITLYSFEQGGTQPYLGIYTDHSSGTYIGRFDSHGLKFGSDTAAANALDDYEEGTWSAADASGQGLTVTTNRGYYIKIGSLVHISASIVFPTTTNTTNVALNLPFTSNINGYYAGSGGHGYTNMNDSMGDTLVTVIENAGANVLFYRNGDQRIRYSDVSGARLDFHAIYQRT